MKILCGDWRSDSELTLRQAEGGPVHGLVFPVSKFAFENISLAKIKRIEPVTKANHRTIGSTLDWGLDAAAILGPVENIVATFASGEVGDRLVVVELHDGRKALIAGTEKEVRPLFSLHLGDNAAKHAGHVSDRRSHPHRAAGIGEQAEPDIVKRLPQAPFSDPPAPGRFTRSDEARRFGKRRPRPTQ